MAYARAVFVLTTNGLDLYYQMTRLAVASLKLTNPQVTVLVVCDERTNGHLQSSGSTLMAEVDEWLPMSVPDGPDEFRNRFLKTNLRQRLDGPFLFLDSDIVVRGDLAEIFTLHADVAGACNHSLPEVKEQIWDQDAEAMNQMGWSYAGDHYLNGGVLFWNDTEGAKLAGEEWHRRWLNSAKELRRFRDQPALNTAIEVTGAAVQVLPDRYNAQFKRRPSTVRDAIIWHYYASQEAVPYTTPELLTVRLLSGEPLIKAEVRALTSASHPWRSHTCLDDLAAANIVKRDRFNGWEGALLQRNLLQKLCGFGWRSVKALRYPRATGN
jgi:hypothetical protein